MQVNDSVHCVDFPCVDVQHSAYGVPDVAVDPQTIRAVMIAEAAPANPADHFYAAGDPLFQRTSVLAFQDAGAQVTTMADILALGFYLTTAVKCGKCGYGLQSGTVETCSYLLEQELALFPSAQVYLLMGDTAIKALNAIARRAGEKRVIPAGATYKMRGGEFSFRGKRVFPSYLQAGPSFFIEKSKRRMIAEDITAALRVLGG